MANFQKILIANRGEIAVRVIRTARELGYRTVAVFSEADADALHVSMADQAVCIGVAAASESYLRADKILEAARRCGADAIHPGYGFLSENADFARQCEAAGITFIGPGADAIELMGSKRLSKIAMLKAGVPCVPGYEGADQGEATLIKEAGEIGFPLMVKASAGGGGRGMRLVHDAASLPEQIKMARSEALAAFGSDELILERAVIRPRHIEIQVFADSYGNCVYLGERDCSIQRRHQKVVEEAPSPFVDEDLRQRMGTAAVEAAKSCDYRGAGTVEFLVDSGRHFYFLEMNTRLQVEHPVTELITGQDLVAWQLRVADGQPLPLAQSDIKLSGHAVEVRLYAEDPRNQFMPQTGTVLQWQLPEREGIRIDHGIKQGQIVSPHYDPMLGKFIAWGENRSEALRRLASAVQDASLLGLNNNKFFLQNILRHPEFVAGEATTAFIEEHFSSDISMDVKQPSALTLAEAALVYFKRGAAKNATGYEWRRSTAKSYVYNLRCEGEPYRLALSEDCGVFTVSVAEATLSIRLVEFQCSHCIVERDGVREIVHFVFQGDDLFIDDGSGHFQFSNETHLPAVGAIGIGSGQIKASMDGAIIAVNVATGDSVMIGQTLVVLEAMKMEHALKATLAGVVKSVSCEVGQQVKSRQLLAEIVAGENT
ncbi:acetyl/propionyl/methylcrotonyl-CoA carboxylase subunit alpha [Zhongshania aliphaticivorans]|uniref:acetyl/propionyl/methylcrotonyl-CoA carboxylase subunit alpha n=1 Tax=Zhongshania aliphaticivorans TaxID=1470434 RepID=UPI0039C9B9C7